MPCTFLGDYQSFSRLGIPLFLERVSAGFPSPAEDYVEKTLDLNELCIQHPASGSHLLCAGSGRVHDRSGNFSRRCAGS